MFARFLTIATLPVALFSIAFVGNAAPNAETKSCCEQQLKCCKPQSACCVADAKLGCCEKGAKCCAEKRSCCTGIQKCCQNGSACCDQMKSCCGHVVKEDAKVSLISLVGEKASCCSRSRDAEFAVAEIPGEVAAKCPHCAAK